MLYCLREKVAYIYEESYKKSKIQGCCGAERGHLPSLGAGRISEENHNLP